MLKFVVNSLDVRVNKSSSKQHLNRFDAGQLKAGRGLAKQNRFRETAHSPS